nr:ribonuclease H-like domain-containing protein [Tanacetum cinerariifolium]
MVTLTGAGIGGRWQLLNIFLSKISFLDPLSRVALNCSQMLTKQFSTKIHTKPSLDGTEQDLANGSNAFFIDKVYVLLWSIWKWRNRVIHASEESKSRVLIEDIFPHVQQVSLLWLSNRCRNLHLDWNSHKVPLAEEVPTASEESSHCQKKRDATAKRIALLVIEFRDSYEVPASAATTETASDGTGKKTGRTVTLTAEDMQKRKNDVKARTTLLLSLPDEHQLRFSKYKTAQELWSAILKTFGGNEATKKTKKNLLKQQYGNFKAEGSETLEQTFNRLSDLDTMSLDDLYNHLKVYESEVHKKSEPNSQNMAFISSAKHSRGNEDINTASVSTTSTNVPTASANIGVATISQDTACAYIASQSSGS